MTENADPNPFQVTSTADHTQAEPEATRLPLFRVALALATVSTLHIFGMLLYLGFAYGEGDVTIQEEPLPLSIAVLTSFYAVVLIVGSFTMIRNGTFSQANVIFVLALVPLLGPCYFTGVPIGIWGLIVLRNPRVKAAFETGSEDVGHSPPSMDASELAAKDLTPQILPISICLMLVCIAQVIFCTWYVLTTDNTTYASYVGATGVYSIFLLFGASSMLRRRSYMLSMMTCLLALLPVIGPCYFGAIPFGIWGLVVLGQPKVRQCFRSM